MADHQLFQDTIAAISTAVSESGIGIIRISGPDAIAAADLVYRSPGGRRRLHDAASHTIHYGFVHDAAGEIIDEVLVSVMRAPRTYTAEDTVEISCHGGILAMRKVLDAVLRCDQREEASCRIHVRAAEPGEFTKRAFLNGRIDLSRAEAVMDLIQAKNEFALKNSVSQVRGMLFQRITELRRQILYQIAHIEASLDDPENLDFAPGLEEFRKELEGWQQSLSHLIRTAEDGRLAAEGIRTVIVGKPNAGKSSLLNLLLGEDRAIVTEIAGTTRDLLTETIHMQGITLLVTDTAGIRESRDIVEQIGVARAKKSIDEADLLLWIVDSSVPLDENDRRVAALLQRHPSVILLNKTDLEEITTKDQVCALLREENIQSDARMIPFSARKGSGYEELTKVLKDMFFHGKLSFNDEVVVTNTRHKLLLEEALASLKTVGESLEQGMSEDFFSIDLMAAYQALGSIIGEEIGEDVVNEIFSKFCMGK
jgi:tRNA modification GTPase